MNHPPTAPELTFSVEGAAAVPFAAAPRLALKLRIETAEAVTVHSVMLRCQLHLEVTRRRYGAGEQSRLFDLFGPPQDWGRTLRNMLWTEANVSVPGFTGSTIVELPVPCTYDFQIASTRYFDALEDGEVPLCLLFSGTIFYAADHGPLQVAQIPWETEAKFSMPVRLWRELMDHYYPDGVWLALPRDLFERLDEYKRRSASPTWERALDDLLDRSEQAVGQIEAEGNLL